MNEIKIHWEKRKRESVRDKDKETHGVLEKWRKRDMEKNVCVREGERKRERERERERERNGERQIDKQSEEVNEEMETRRESLTL